MSDSEQWGCGGGGGGEGGGRGSSDIIFQTAISQNGMV